VDVTGRFVLDDPAVPLPRPPGSPGLLISARLAGDQLPGSGGLRHGHAGEDRIFTLTGMFGKRTIDVANVPRGWYVKSIRYEGKDIIDVPTEFKAGTDPAALEIVLSSRGAVVAGRVLDDRGEPVRGARVIMLPADPARRNRLDLTYATASRAGTFRVGPQRGGDYLIIALAPQTELPDPRDRDRLARLAESGERLTLSADEERTLDLRVVRPR
jgi:hypothetical protein